ncbi:MarR family winged helix-turn-helix transcriptional regulator [Cumulibacter manganitolerans]|uniref:MarR family winged helix-turn-helix transcriptional regulator n=1 Tax=Cumulibacter manganitolerans TaxID=1884992 RepID=UPI00129522B6|nr:MarR family transcriptional regulator [Cumulibacter manganitolerans]
MTNVANRDVAALQRLTRDLLAVAMTTVQEISDVSMPQMRLLFAVADAGSAPCGSLAHQLGVAGSSVTRLADRMVAAGYLDRRHSPDNRSVVLLSLTDSGAAVIDAVVERRARIFRDALGELDPSARAGLLRGLDGLHAALDAAAQPAER